MNHTQAVLLGHVIPMLTAFQLWCWYQSGKRKKVRQRANVNGLKGKSIIISIPQLRKGMK